MNLQQLRNHQVCIIYGGNYETNQRTKNDILAKYSQYQITYPDSFLIKKMGPLTIKPTKTVRQLLLQDKIIKEIDTPEDYVDVSIYMMNLNKYEDFLPQDLTPTKKEAFTIIRDFVEGKRDYLFHAQEDMNYYITILRWFSAVLNKFRDCNLVFLTSEPKKKVHSLLHMHNLESLCTFFEYKNNELYLETRRPSTKLDEKKIIYDSVSYNDYIFLDTSNKKMYIPKHCITFNYSDLIKSKEYWLITEEGYPVEVNLKPTITPQLSIEELLESLNDTKVEVIEEEVKNPSVNEIKLQEAYSYDITFDTKNETFVDDIFTMIQKSKIEKAYAIARDNTVYSLTYKSQIQKIYTSEQKEYKLAFFGLNRIVIGKQLLDYFHKHQIIDDTQYKLLTNKYSSRIAHHDYTGSQCILFRDVVTRDNYYFLSSDCQFDVKRVQKDKDYELLLYEDTIYCARELIGKPEFSTKVILSLDMELTAYNWANKIGTDFLFDIPNLLKNMNIDSAELIGKKEGKEQRIDLLKDNSIFLLSIERRHFDNHFKLEIVGKRKEYAVWLLIEELKKHDILTEQSYNAIESRYTHITAHIDKKDTYVLRLTDDDNNHHFVDNQFVDFDIQNTKFWTKCSIIKFDNKCIDAYIYKD